MKRLTTAVPVCAVALFAFVPGAGAGDMPKPNNVAAKMCQAEKQADRAAFEATYGDRAMRDCKRAHRAEATTALQNASQACRAEQEADPAGFAATYGTNGNDKNAFGKCVSAKVKEDAAEQAETFDNAAQQCRSERRADPEAFAETYGTNRNNRNAFGKCVSQHVRQGEYEPAPS